MKSVRVIKMLCYVYCLVQLSLMQVNTTRANTEGFIVGNKTKVISGRIRRQFGIYMNFGAPSPRQGLITSWNFYYDCAPRINLYHASLMMYHLTTGNNAQSYEVLPESVQEIYVECEKTRITMHGNRTLIVDQQFRVEEGDIVALCLPNDGTEPLRTVSTVNPKRDGASNVREFSINQEEGCNSERLQKINFQDLDLHQDLQLHLYAEAITVAEVSMTTNGPILDNATTTNSGMQTDTVLNVLFTSTTNSNPESGFNPSTSLDLAVIKIIFISSSVALLTIVMIIIFILVMVVAVMWRRRRRRHKDSTIVDTELDCQNCYYSAIYTAAKTEFNMSDNVSYNIHDIEPPSQHYEYPDFSATVLDGSNIYETID